jgi:hypothetical protein
MMAIAKNSGLHLDITISIIKGYLWDYRIFRVLEDYWRVCRLFAQLQVILCNWGFLRNCRLLVL